MLNIGIDWASCKHDFFLRDDSGKLALQGVIPHSAEGFASFKCLLHKHEADPSSVRIAIETNDGALLHWLIDQGYSVFGLNPKATQRLRDPYSPSGAKDDKSDALIFSEAVSKDASYLRTLRPTDSHTEEIDSWMNLCKDISDEKTRLSQKTRAILNQWCPEYSLLLDDLNAVWQRRLLEEFPLQQDLAAAHGNHVRAFLGKLRLKKASVEKLAQTKAAAPLPVPAARLGALRAQIRILVTSLQSAIETLSGIHKELKRLEENHPQAHIYASLPVRGVYTTASLMVLFGRPCEDHRRELACRCGAAPVTVKSGKSCRVKRRRAFDHGLAPGLYYFALTSIAVEGCWAREYYQAKRDGGTGHYAALRCLIIRWIRIITRMLKSQMLYDEQFHQANRRLHMRKPA